MWLIQDWNLSSLTSKPMYVLNIRYEVMCFVLGIQKNERIRLLPFTRSLQFVQKNKRMNIICDDKGHDTCITCSCDRTSLDLLLPASFPS